MMQEVTRQGHVQGIRVCRGAPSIFHLLFADDCILFSRATPTGVGAIVNVLQRYEQLSGQKVNFHKSELCLSENVQEDQARDIESILGVRRVKNHVLYLGLSTVAGRSKRAMFSFIKERVWGRLQGWKEKLLSGAGRQILIKTIAQAIPTYVMQCFLLPTSLCEELRAIISHYFWGQRRQESKLHICSWRRLCLPKEKGGLGFRDFQCFNKALLAKQGWRLLTNPNSLLARVMKAKYFPILEFMQAALGPQPSYIWRSILAGREF
jgi:hypothetical protein